MNQSIEITSRCAYNIYGSQCEELTTVTHPYCELHTRIVLGVEVRPSTITQAGMGLYAVREFVKGTFLFHYTGERLSHKKYHQRYGESGIGIYGITLNKRIVIDACRTDSGVARYICTYHGSGKKPNVAYYSTGKNIEMWTLRSISVGEELLSDYGREMIVAMGILEK